MAAVSHSANATEPGFLSDFGSVSNSGDLVLNVRMDVFVFVLVLMLLECGGG